MVGVPHRQEDTLLGPADPAPVGEGHLQRDLDRRRARVEKKTLPRLLGGTARRDLAASSIAGTFRRGRAGVEWATARAARRSPRPAPPRWPWTFSQSDELPSKYSCRRRRRAGRPRARDDQRLLGEVPLHLREGVPEVAPVLLAQLLVARSHRLQHVRLAYRAAASWRRGSRCLLVAVALALLALPGCGGEGRDPVADRALIEGPVAATSPASARSSTRSGRGRDHEQGATALIAAAYGDHVDAARLLVDASADVNVQDTTRQSAYLIATSEGVPSTCSSSRSRTAPT